MLIDHWATVRKLMEDTALSAGEILQMDMSEYARLTNRETGAEAAARALDAQYEASVPQVPQEPPAPAQEAQNAPHGIDVASLDMQAYASLRQQMGNGQGSQYGKGIMDAGQGTDAWVRAAQSKVGRTQYGQANTQDAARVDSSKYLARNEPAAGRTTWYR